MPITSSPTQRPTSTPTASPVTSKPSINDETYHPTSRPTSRPSINYNQYVDSVLYSDTLTNTLAAINATSQDRLFTFFNYKSLNVQGTCEEWQTFSRDVIYLPFETLKFTALSAYFAVENITTHNVQTANYTCGNTIKVQSIIAAMTNNIAYSISCDGNTWRTFLCSSQMILCVNCVKSCSANVICPGQQLSTMSPCRTTSCKRTATSYGIVRAHYEEVPLYPLFVGNLSVSAGASSITVNGSFSSSGLIHCAAQANGTTAPFTSTVDIANRGQAGAIDADGFVTMSLRSLFPLTLYTVVCYTEDFRSNRMPFAVAAAAARTMSTVGFNALLFDKVNGTEISSSSNPRSSNPSASLTASTITVSSNTPIQHSKDITLAVLVDDSATDICVSSLSTRNASKVALSPSSLILASGATASAASFIVNGPTGCYTIIAKGTDVTFPAAALRIFLRGVAIVRQPPTIVSAIFANDGYSVSIVFNVATDKASTYFKNHSIPITNWFACDMLLANISSLRCSWVSTTSLRVDLTTANTPLQVGKLVTLLPHRIRASCESSCLAYPTLNSNLSVVLAGPANALSPVMALTAVNSYILCANVNYSLFTNYSNPTTPYMLSLDASQSQSRAIRNDLWTSIKWLAIVNDGIVTNLDPTLTAFLNANGRVDRLINIPAIYLTPGVLTVRLEGKNFFNLSSSKEISISIQEDIMVPIGQVKLPSVYYRYQPLQMFAQVDFASGLACQTSGISAKLVYYAWRVYDKTDNYRFLSDIQYQSTSRDPSIFKLPAYSLTSRHEYLILVTFSYSNSSNKAFTTNAVGNLLVNPGEVVANIAGSSSYTSSVFKSLTLNAGGSKQQDAPSTALNYAWRCQQVYPTYGGSCLYVNETVNGGNGKNSVTKWTIPSSSLFGFSSTSWPYTVYNITLVAWDANDRNSFGTDSVLVELVYNKGQGASSLVTVGGVDDPVRYILPEVAIDAVYTSDVLSHAVQAITFNKDQRIVFNGSLNNPFVSLYDSDSTGTLGVFAYWSIAEQALSPADSLTVIGKNYTYEAGDWNDSTPLGYQLVLRPGLLEEGQTYTMQLHAVAYSVGPAFYLSSPYQATAEITFTINQAPFGGAARIAPAAGVSFQTLFTWLTYGWTDDVADFPLSFALATAINGAAFTVKDYDFSSTLSTFLAPSGENQRSTVVSFVRDVYGAENNFTLADAVEVLPFDSNGTTVLQQLANQLRKAKVNGRTLDIMQTSLLAAMAYGHGNCSYAPNCTTRHRSGCRLTAHTCGTCLPGYVGVEGDANSPCTSNSLVIDGGALVAHAMSSISCSSDFQCASGQCVNLTCVDRIKVCSGCDHGQCMTISHGVSSSQDCNYLDRTCDVYCACSVGYYGADCSLDSTADTNALVSDICIVQLPPMFSAVEITANILKSVAQTVSVLLHDRSIVRADLLEKCVDAFFAATSLDLELTSKRAVFGDILTSFVYPLSRASVNLLRDSVVDRMDGISQSYCAVLAFGEEGLSFASEAFAFSSARFLIDRGGNSSRLILPNALYRAASALPASGVWADYSGTSLTHQLVLMSFPYWDTGDSNATSLIVSSEVLPLSNITAVNTGVNLAMVLTNKAPVSYAISGNNTPIVVYCAPTVLPHNLTVNCSSDGWQYAEVLVVCPGAFSFGHVQVICPYTSFQPTCQRRSNSTWEDACTLVEYSETSTTCSCTLNGDRRRLISSEDEFSATSRAIRWPALRTDLNTDQLHFNRSVKRTYAMALVNLCVLVLVASRIFFAYRISPFDRKNKLVAKLKARDQSLWTPVRSFVRIWGGAKVHVGEDPEDDSSTLQVKQKPQPAESYSPQIVRSRTLTSFFMEILPLEFKNISRWQIFGQALRYRHVLSMHEAADYDRDIPDAAATTIYDNDINTNAYLFANCNNIFTTAYYKSLCLALQVLQYLFLSNMLLLILYNNKINTESSDGFLPCEEMSVDQCTAAMDGLGISHLCRWDADKLNCRYTITHALTSPAFLASNVLILYYFHSVLWIFLEKLANYAILYVYHHNAQALLAPEHADKLQLPLHRSALAGRLAVTWNPYLQSLHNNQITINKLQDEMTCYQSLPANWMKAALIYKLKLLYENKSTEEELEYVIANKQLTYLTFVKAVKLNINNSRLLQLLKAQPTAAAVQDAKKPKNRSIALKKKSYDYMDSFRVFASSKFLKQEQAKGGAGQGQDNNDLLQRELQALYALLDNDTLSTEQLIFNARYYNIRYHRSALTRRLKKVKKSTKMLASELNGLHTSHDQDKFLVLQYLLSLAPDTLSRLVTRSVLCEPKRYLDSLMATSPSVLLMAFMLFVAYLLIAIILLFLYTSSVDVQAFGAWLVIIVLTVCVDYLLAQPVAIYLTVVNIAGYARMPYLASHYTLLTKAIYLLRRRAGLLQINLHDIAHVFNPVVRLARKVSKLPASRLLMAVNQGDLLLVPNVQQTLLFPAVPKPGSAVAHRTGVIPVKLRVWAERGSRALYSGSILVTRGCLAAFMHLPSSLRTAILRGAVYGLSVWVLYALYAAIMAAAGLYTSLGSDAAAIIGYVLLVTVGIAIRHEWMSTQQQILFYPANASSRDQSRSKDKPLPAAPKAFAGLQLPPPEIKQVVSYQGNGPESDGRKLSIDTEEDDDELKGMTLTGPSPPIPQQQQPIQLILSPQHGNVSAPASPDERQGFSPGPQSDSELAERGEAGCGLGFGFPPSSPSPSVPNTGRSKDSSKARAAAAALQRKKRLMRRHRSHVGGFGDSDPDLSSDEEKAGGAGSLESSLAGSPASTPSKAGRKPTGASAPLPYSPVKAQLQFFSKYESGKFFVGGTASPRSPGSKDAEDLVDAVDYGADPFHRRKTAAAAAAAVLFAAPPVSAQVPPMEVAETDRPLATAPTAESGDTPAIVPPPISAVDELPVLGNQSLRQSKARRALSLRKSQSVSYSRNIRRSMLATAPENEEMGGMSAEVDVAQAARLWGGAAATVSGASTSSSSSILGKSIVPALPALHPEDSGTPAAAVSRSGSLFHVSDRMGSYRVSTAQLASDDLQQSRRLQAALQLSPSNAPASPQRARPMSAVSRPAGPVRATEEAALFSEEEIIVEDEQEQRK